VLPLSADGKGVSPEELVELELGVHMLAGLPLLRLIPLEELENPEAGRKSTLE
jgi:hypothetical protein